MSGRVAFYATERTAWRKSKREDEVYFPVTHRYLNCARPFNPKDSALLTLMRHTEGLRIGVNGLVDEYPMAIAQGRGHLWERAAIAYAELFAHTGTEYCALNPVGVGRGR